MTDQPPTPRPLFTPGTFLAVIGLWMLAVALTVAAAQRFNRLDQALARCLPSDTAAAAR